MSGCIPEEFVQKQVDALLDAAKRIGSETVMGRAALIRAEYYMDLVEAWRNRRDRGESA